MARAHVLRFSVIALAVVSALATLPAAARDDVIAATGDSVPGSDPGVTFSGFASEALLNNAGQVAYFGVLAGSGISSDNNTAIFLDSAVVAREGDQAPGLDAGILLAPVSFSMRLNDAGNVAFQANLTGDGIDFANDRAIYRNGSLIAREGNQALGTPTGVTHGFFSSTMHLSQAGHVTFQSFLNGANSANDTALYSNSSLVAREGNSVPGLPGVQYGPLGSASRSNSAGQDAFSANLITGSSSNNAAIFRDSTVVARRGDAAPGLAGATFSTFGPVQINEAGQVAFFTGLGGSGVDATNSSAIYRDATLVVRRGNAVPGLAGLTFGNFFSSGFALGEGGDVVFSTSLEGAGVTSANNQAFFRNSTMIAREGEAAGGLGEGVVLASFSTSAPVVNEAGLVAFASVLAGPGIDSSNNAALWLGDGVELVSVLRRGDTRDGKTVASIVNPQEGQLNDHGQLAYRTTFTDGTEGIFLFTPDARWRQTFSGSWDTDSNWTLGLGTAPLYDTKIDPGSSLTVQGPSTDRSVRTLEIGGGAGVATLSLRAGKITSLEASTKVLGNGVLTGDGAIAGGVLNRGTVRAQNVTIEGGLTNEGLIEGHGRLNANVVNQAGGRISVGAGQSMRLGGTVMNTTSGTVDVLGGALEVTGALINDGQIAGRDALLRFSGGLFNGGQLALTFGLSDVFGPITNATAGQIVVSGASDATFYQDMVNDGDVQVSAGSQAVYFGDITGNGRFIGAGTHFFEGTVNPGSSPGVLTQENPIYGAGSELVFELAGLLPGTQYDRLIVTDTLTLRGGAFIVSLLGDFLPAAGDVFDLMDFGTLALEPGFGSFTLPTLANDLAWNTSSLYLDGSISVAAIPEPETYALMLAGLGLLGFVARRRRKWGQTPN